MHQSGRVGLSSGQGESEGDFPLARARNCGVGRFSSAGWFSTQSAEDHQRSNAAVLSLKLSPFVSRI